MKISALPSYLQPGSLPSGADAESKLLHRLRQSTGQVAGGLHELKPLVEAWDKIPKSAQGTASKNLGINGDDLAGAAADLVAASPKESKPKKKSMSPNQDE